MTEICGQNRQHSSFVSLGLEFKCSPERSCCDWSFTDIPPLFYKKCEWKFSNQKPAFLCKCINLTYSY